MGKRCELCNGKLVKLAGQIKHPKSSGRKKKTERYKTPNYKCIECGQVYEEKLEIIDPRIITVCKIEKSI